jgi:hypothetical protein
MCAAWRLTATQVKDRVLKVAFAFAPAVPTNRFIPLATASTYAPVKSGALLRRKELANVANPAVWTFALTVVVVASSAVKTIDVVTWIYAAFRFKRGRSSISI